MKKYPRTMHLPWSPGTTSDDRIARSVDHMVGEAIVITEKLDGENCAMTRHGVYARSHAAFTTSPWSQACRQLHQLLRHSIDEGMYLFGENMEGIHSIEYPKLDHYFHLFGVRHDQTWLTWDEVEDIAYLLDVPTVPVLFRGSVSSTNELRELVDTLVGGPSEYGPKIEGIVVRKTWAFTDQEFGDNVYKWVRKGHVQTDEHWTRNWQRAQLLRFRRPDATNAAGEEIEANKG